MPNAYYTCNLLPLELVARTGYSPRWLGEHLQDPGAPARRDALSIHPMTCPYVTRLVAAADALLDGAARRRRAPGAGRLRRHETTWVICSPPPTPAGCSPFRSARSSEDGVVQTTGFRPGPARTVAGRQGRRAQNRQAPGGDRGPVPSTGQRGAEHGRECGRQAVPARRLPYAASTGRRVRGGRAADGRFPAAPDRAARRTVSGLESCTSPDRWRPLAEAGGAAETTPGTQKAPQGRVRCRPRSRGGTGP